MQYLKIKKLANKTIFYQLIKHVDNTDKVLLEGSLYCSNPICSCLFVTDCLNNENCLYLKEDGSLDLLVDCSGYDVFSSNVHKSYNEALIEIRDAILNLYSNLLDR